LVKTSSAPRQDIAEYGEDRLLGEDMRGNYEGFATENLTSAHCTVAPGASAVADRSRRLYVTPGAVPAAKLVKGDSISGSSSLVSMMKAPDLGYGNDTPEFRRLDGSFVWGVLPKR
jgi:hypothetical protein